jgi:hypothetical protein
MTLGQQGDVAERLKALSTAMLDSTSFLLLRNSLRHQFLRSTEISGLVAQASEGGQLASSVMSVLRNGSAAGSNVGSSDGGTSSVSIPTVFVEGVGQTAIDFAMKAFTNTTNSNIALTQQLQQNGEQRQLLAGRMHRDAMIWTARGIDTQLRDRIHRRRRSRPPSPPHGQSPITQPTTSSGHLSAQVPLPPVSTDTSSSTDALHFIVNAAQREWRALINVRVESLKILALNPSLRSSRSAAATASSGGGDGNDPESSSSPRTAANGAAPALTSDDLLNICLERANAAVVGAMKRRATAAAAHANQSQPHHVDTNKDSGSTSGGSTGTATRTSAATVQVENLGYFSSFHSSVLLVFQEANMLPTISDLREALSELDPAAGPARVSYQHQGISTTPPAEDLFMHLIESGDRPDLLCHNVLQRGVPPSLRRLVYAKLLHLPLSLSPLSTGALAVNSVSGCRTRRVVRFATANAAKALAESAQQGRSSQTSSGDSTLQARQLIRQMVASDASSRIGDSDKYFLFLDECTAVVTALLEDSNVADYHLKRQIEQHGGDVAAYLSSNISPSGMRVPTCGVMPFSSTASVVAPLSYITGDLCEMYELAAAMQGQLWSPVQSATPELFAMMILFERLIAHFAPAAVFHCHTKLSFSLLNVTFKWMVTGFSELFEPAQVLEAWDLLVGVNAQNFFASTNSRNAAAGAAMPHWVLAAIAASVVVFRAPLIQQCFSQFQVQRLFDDCVKLSPVLLLQQMLFLL